MNDWRPVSFPDLARAILAAPRTRATLLVGIGGRGGAGKTTFAERLAREMDAAVVQIDHFIMPLDVTPMRSNANYVSHFDWLRLELEVLAPLAENRTARYQPFDWDTQRMEASQTVDPGGVVLVEGVGALRLDVLDYRIWIECPRAICLQRVVLRDGDASEPEWKGYWGPKEDRYIAAERPQDRADLIVDGRLPVGDAFIGHDRRPPELA
jgi:uridine kinase